VSRKVGISHQMPDIAGYSKLPSHPELRSQPDEVRLTPSYAVVVCKPTENLARPSSERAKSRTSLASRSAEGRSVVTACSFAIQLRQIFALACPFLITKRDALDKSTRK
jgi:hypothetical protein